MPTQPDVLIIGGGVIGLTTAYFLAREGVRVEVLDRGDFGKESSWAGAGILPPGNPAHAQTPYDQLRAHSAVLHPLLASELRERTGIDNGYLRCGGIELGAAHEGTSEEWRSEGVTIERLDEHHLHSLEQALSGEFTTGYFLPDMAQIRNPRHLKALLAACSSLGARLRPGCPVQGFVREGDRVVAARTVMGDLSAGRFIIAAGAWSDPLLAQVSMQAGIRPVRGQIALLQCPAPVFRRILIHGSRYLVPRPDGLVLVGSTEEDVGFDKSTTAEAISSLLDLAQMLVPSLAGARVQSCWAGLRPGSSRELPYLGPMQGFANLYVASGHYRAGLLMSPATALVMKELILGQKLTVPLEAFSLERNLSS